jgi:glycosyltransferase involved in cell wall biosynthesis
MKILMCHNYYRENGGENLIFDQQRQILEEHGHQVMLYTRDSAEVADYNWRRKAAFFPNTVFSRQTYTDIRRLIQQIRPDVAIVQNVFPLISPSIYHALAAESVPTVQLVFNYRLICPDAHLYTHGQICERCVAGDYIHAVRWKCFRQSYLLSALYAVTLAWHHRTGTFQRLIDAFVVPDRTLKAKLVQAKFDPAKIFINPNAFDLSAVEPSWAAESYLLYVGRFVAQKGVLTLLRAMCEVRSPIGLWLVGRGPLQMEIARFIEQNRLERVRLFSDVWGSELQDLISKAYALVVPSEWYDNSPRIVSESFAAGKPVIGSRIGGIQDCVMDESTGLLFEPGNATDLAAKIDRLAGNPSLQQRLGQQARQFMEERYGADQHYQQFFAVLESLIQR